MDGIIIFAGCIISFLCGAYVRSPFSIINISVKKKRERDCEDDSEERQWENFWNYNGKEQ